MGHYNNKINEQLFENPKVSTSYLRTFIETCKDVNGNEYLPFDEQKRLLDMYRPLNAEERDLILMAEEETKMMYECLPDQLKEKINMARRDYFPYDIVFQYDFGYPLKTFQPNVPIEEDPNYEKLLKNLNRSAEFGISYSYVNDPKHGHLILETIKPSFKINVEKLSKQNKLDDLKEIILEKSKVLCYFKTKKLFK
jgi:hypothetical protein